MKTILALAAVLAFSAPCIAEKTAQQPLKPPRWVDVDPADYEWKGLLPPSAPASTPPEPPKRELGPIDRWRYDSCRTEASKAPTREGVRSGLQVCHEKFGQ